MAERLLTLRLSPFYFHFMTSAPAQVAIRRDDALAAGVSFVGFQFFGFYPCVHPGGSAD